MTNKKIIKYAIFHALATLVYVAIVALIMTNANALFGTKPSTLTAIGILLLLVTSAAITGSLVLLRPAVWYFNGNKNEAIKLALYTIAFIAIITFIVLLFLGLQPK